VRKLLAVPIALAAILWCGAIGAADQRFGDEDVALLPAYCKDTQSFAPYYGSPGGYEARIRQIGPTFHHLHHYCLGLVYINQAVVSKSEQRKKRLYNNALQDIDYVLHRAPADFVLLPEILVKRGIALTHLKKFPLAEASFRKAIQTKPDYWPAYRDLATLYIENGKRDLARTTLENGLAVVSEKRVLQMMLNDLKNN
jgi:tetratricopeptide (TPR) repeat protein